MKVICIDNSKLITPSNSDLLTIGKIYDVVDIVCAYDKNNQPDIYNSIYHVIDDIGRKNTFSACRFKLLREESLNKLIE